VDLAQGRLVAEVAHFSDYGLGNSDEELPSIMPALDGFSVDLCTGAATAEIPLKVPPGINGLTPELVLRYNSGLVDATNQMLMASGDQFPFTDADNTCHQFQCSGVGLGWTLDVGAIYADYIGSPGGWPAFDYYLVLHGRTMKLKSVDGTAYRAEQDEFLRIQHLYGSQENQCDFNRYWQVEDTDGRTYRFGYTATAEHRFAAYQFGPTGYRPWQYSLDRITDRHGNTIDFTYSEYSQAPVGGPPEDQDYDQTVFLSEIHYGANPSQGLTDHTRHIYFDSFGEREDLTWRENVYTKYVLRSKVDRIRMYVGAAPARTYDLGHAYINPLWHNRNATTNTSTWGAKKLVLTSLTEKGADGAALPAMTFTYLNNSEIPGASPTEYFKGQLGVIDNDYGGKTWFNYEGHTPVDAGDLKRRFRVTSVQTETGVGTAGGVSSLITKTYGYGTSRNASSNDYRGHEWVQVTDAAGHFQKTWFYTKPATNGKSEAEVTVLQSRPYASERWAAGAGAYTTREETDWSYAGTAGGANFIRRDEVRQYRRISTGGLVDRKTRYEYDDGAGTPYGNLLRMKEYTSAGAAAGAWARHKAYEYYPSVASDRYLVSRVAREILYKPGAGDGEVVRDTRSCYDGAWDHTAVIGSGGGGGNTSGRGLLTAVRKVLNGTQCVDTTYGYDAFGNRTTVTAYGAYGTTGGALATGDPRATTTAFEGTYHTFPSQITNPLGQIATGTWDARWGRPLTATTLRAPADGAYGTTNWTYDEHGRLKKVEGPNASGPGGGYRRTTQYDYGTPVTTNGRTTTRRTSRGG
jgi:hypothetical protein